MSETDDRPHVTLLHVRNSRKGAKRYQGLLTSLTDAASDAVAALGWRASVIASAEHHPDYSIASARRSDMVVILGGEDIDPRLYGAPSGYPDEGHHEPGTDRTHIAVVLDAVRYGTPLLGICRGHQLINVALGGTLNPHISTVQQHRGAPGKEPFRRTKLTSDSDSDLRKLCDTGGDVLCTHHQAIDRLGDGLEVVARAPDGVIEAVVHTRAPVTGVQWHPEHPRVARTQLTALLQRMDSQRPVAHAQTSATLCHSA